MEQGRERMKAQEIDQLREKIADPTYLPTFSEIAGAFPGERRDTRIFIDFCTEHDIFELFNKEYIDSLGSYLQRRIEALSQEEPVMILEVGAGKGQLTHWLKKYLEEHGLDEKRVKLIATDDQSLKGSEKPPFTVEKIDKAAAIAKYQPDIVLCSWMPLDEDWTPIFRNEPSVKEYILIGETRGGSCGSDETWTTCPDGDDLDEPNVDLSSGFYRVDLNGDEPGTNKIFSQIARTDTLPLGQIFSYSATVSFRRMDS